MKMKKLTALALSAAMLGSLAGCGQNAQTAQTSAAAAESETAAETEAAVTEAAADDAERPEGVTPEDWEAMKQEPVFGKEINYLFNGGACVSAKYLAEELGYYKEYGINATYVQGNSVVDTVGTGKCMWGTDHIATMLVPVTNGVNMTFVAGAHVGCKSIFVPADSDIKTVEDLRGKKIAIHDGIGNSDQNICYRLIDEFGVDPTKEVEFLNIEDNAATIAQLESGDIDASIFSDYFVLANYRDDLRKVASITSSPEFKGEACCVTAMNNDFIAENPVHAKYVVKAIKRAGQYARLNSEEAVQLMYDTDKMTGKQEDQQEFWDSLHFGLSDAYTEQSLRRIADDYIRLGVITKQGLSTDDVMKMAWTNICPDEEIEGLTVGDPLEPENAVIPIQQKGEAAPGGSDSTDTETNIPSAIADMELTITDEEKAAMEKEPAYNSKIIYWYDGGNCTAAPYVAQKLGYFDTFGIQAECLSGAEVKESIGTNRAQFGISHIASLLVPITNNVNYSFVMGAHVGCKSLYVLNDSDYNKTEDLKGTKIGLPNGIGNSDYNITARLLDKDGINPMSDVELTAVESSACVAAMQNGEISAALLSDTYAYSMVKDGTLRMIRSLTDPDFSEEPCCVVAMNNDFLNENPIMAEKIVDCLKKASAWMRTHTDEAVEMLLADSKISGDFDMNTELWDQLKFGLTDEYTEKGLEQIIDDYIRLDLITSTDDADALLEKAWHPLG